MRVAWILAILVACAAGEPEPSLGEDFGEGALLALPAPDEAANEEVEGTEDVVGEVVHGPEVDASEVGASEGEVEAVDAVDAPAPLGLDRLRALTRGGCARAPSQLPSLLVGTAEGSAWDVSCLIDVATEDLVRCPCVTPRSWPSASTAVCVPVEAATAELRERFVVYARSELGREVVGPVQLCTEGGSGR